MPIDFNRKPGLKPGLVIYFTVGDPDLATTRNVALAAIDAGADVLELEYRSAIRWPMVR